MKLSLAFIATVSATGAFIKFTDPIADGNQHCELVYDSTGALVTEFTAGVDGVQNCEFKAIRENKESIEAFREAMGNVVASISRQVCGRYESPDKLFSMGGAHTLHEWREDPDGNRIPGLHVKHGTAFCKYDCNTGHFDSTGQGDCSPCITSCSIGYTPIRHEDDTQCITKCEEDTNYCPSGKQSFSGATVASRTPTTLTYGHTQTIVCKPGYRAVGNPSMTCINDGSARWLKEGRCVSEFNVFDTQIVEATNTCAGQTIARCPYNEVAIGGGMYNAWERGTIMNKNASTSEASLFEQAHPNGDREWVCDMGEATDCGHVTCYAVCVPASTVVIDDVSARYDHSLIDTVAHKETVDVQCAEGFTVTGIGMRNHLASYDEASLFEEFSYQGNGAVCNMGAAGSEPDFTCYARCAKASNLGNTGKQLTCVTKTTGEGLKHDVTCDSPFQSNGSGQQAVGVGMKQSVNWADDSSFSWFENAQPTGKSSVHCDSGNGDGLNTCQARCCTYE